MKVYDRDKNIPPKEFLKKKRNPIYVILDNLRSAYNVGAIFRTCDAFLIRKLILCGITAHPPNKKLKKTAMLAERYVSWEYIKDTDNAVRKLQEEGVAVYGCERTEVSESLKNVEVTFPCGLIFGNEANGVAKKVLEICDGIIEIPMMGFKNSLNVATTAGIIIYGVMQKIDLQENER
jgi:23S rRNA (guanosine2251-2'-O)-methyltransferase